MTPQPKPAPAPEPLQQARATIQAHAQARVAEAQRLIEQALAATDCILLPEITITGDRITATVRILPR